MQMECCEDIDQKTPVDQGDCNFFDAMLDYIGSKDMTTLKLDMDKLA